MANSLIPVTAPISLTQGQAVGDMRASVYDPQGKGMDVYAYADAAAGGSKAKVYTLTLASSSWAADSTSGMYTQAVTIAGATANTKVDLDADLLTAQNIPSAIRIYNDNGSCCAYTVQAPTSDITVQATAIETEAGA